MYWVGDSSVFLHKPRSSAEQSLPCPPRSWTASVGPTKKLGYAVPIVLLAWFRERSPPCRCLPRAFSALVFFYLYSSGFVPLLRVRHWFRKAGLCFRSPGCRFGACCKMSLAHGGRKTRKHTMQSEKLKIMFDCSNGKLLKREQLPPLQRKAGLKWLNKKYCKMLLKDFLKHQLK